MKNKLIIFDMDNTILQSHIDFDWMMKEVMAILHEHGLDKYRARTVAQTITLFCQSPDYDPELEQLIWDKVCQVETEGMDKAVAEPGAVEALSYLSRYAYLAVLSNNTDAAIGDNLERLGLAAYLNCVAGRNSVPLLKPSPLGMLHIKDMFPDIELAHTVTVGDAIIDAQAAEAAGIKFVAYNRSRSENWQKFAIKPLLELHQWDKTSCDALRRICD